MIPLKAEYISVVRLMVAEKTVGARGWHALLRGTLASMTPRILSCQQTEVGFVASNRPGGKGPGGPAYGVGLRVEAHDGAKPHFPPQGGELGRQIVRL